MPDPSPSITSTCRALLDALDEAQLLNPDKTLAQGKRLEISGSGEDLVITVLGDD